MRRLVSVLLATALIIMAFVMPADALVVDYRYGDINKDNEVDVLDAAQIQKHCADILVLEHIEYALADFDNDRDVSVLDATAIQKYSADLIENPRDDTNEYLEHYVEIEDIKIEAVTGANLLAEKAIDFEIIFDDVYTALNDKNARYVFTFKGITDEDFLKEYRRDIYTKPNVGVSFENPGIYEVEVKVYNLNRVGVYSFNKRFEILEKFEFDQMRFVDNTYHGIYQEAFPKAPADATELSYELVFDNSEFHIDGYGECTYSDYFVALVHTKAEYDALFDINNTKFDDEFFEDKSLVVAVTMGLDYYDYFTIRGISYIDDVMYVKVVHGNSNDDLTAAPMCPRWYSFASVDKADVEHIESLQRVI